MTTITKANDTASTAKAPWYERFLVFLKRINTKIEATDNRWLWAVLILYVVSIAIISAYHEPWFDEAQSWMIARDASYHDMIFYIPHYEGHPPLWWLYLSLFAKTGVPYELGLKTAAILLNTVAMGILLFKAPFPKIVRCVIPFTYFFFYQYGVISRCYSLLMLGFILMALFWKDRDEKPFKVIVTMCLVCCSTAYGLLLCGGLTLVWLGQIIKRIISKQLKIKDFFLSKTFLAMFLLLILAIGLIILIIPQKDTIAIHATKENPFLFQLFYMLIIAPLDATCFSSTTETFYLNEVSLGYSAIVSAIILFLIYAPAIYLFGKKHHSLCFLIIPYCFFSIFASSVYYYTHHSGIITIFIMFWFWISIEMKKNDIMYPFETKSFNHTIIQLMFIMLISCVCFYGLFWNISASVLDINSNYSSGREISNFLKESHLDNLHIMTSWSTLQLSDGREIENILSQDAPVINPYFNHNLFFSFNNGDSDKGYNIHRIPTQDEINNTFENWKKYGPPDVLIKHPNISLVYGQDVSYSQYTLVKTIEFAYIYKNFQYFIDIPFMKCQIYLRNDLLNKYGF